MMNDVVKNLYSLFLGADYTVASTEQIDFVWIITYHRQKTGDAQYLVKPFPELLAREKYLGRCDRANAEDVQSTKYSPYWKPKSNEGFKGCIIK